MADNSSLLDAQTSSEDVSDYEMRLRAAQRGERIYPVVWHEGQYVSVPPLSPLHLRIGFAPPFSTARGGAQLAGGSEGCQAEPEERRAQQ
jgi:hypothetical protein